MSLNEKYPYGTGLKGIIAGNKIYKWEYNPNFGFKFYNEKMKIINKIEIEIINIILKMENLE